MMKQFLPMSLLLFLSSFVSIGLSIGPNQVFAQEPATNTAEHTKLPATRWFKGNLHTHSLWSDGTDFPEMIVKWYADRDYNFLALTDHNILSEGEKWMPQETVVRRGGPKILDKYRAAFGEDWIETDWIKKKETFKNENGKDQTMMIHRRKFRLKGLDEFRGHFEKPNEFMLMTGEEISDKVGSAPVHMNATNLKTLLRPAGGKTVQEAMTNNLRAAIEQSESIGQPILVHLNHPNFGWAVTGEDLAMTTLERFYEVYNGHPGVNQLGDKVHPSVERLWDIANTIRIDQLNAQPMLGLATDDCHEYHGRGGSQPGRGWVMVRAAELSPKAILDAMNRGDFYASSGVEINDIVVDESGIKIEIAPKEGENFMTTFIGTRKGFDSESKPRGDMTIKAGGKKIRLTRKYSSDVGAVLATETGNTAEYKFTGDELYVRAVVTSSAAHPNPSFKDQKQQAWTQPATK